MEQDLYLTNLAGIFAISAPTEDLKGTETYYSLHLPGKFDRVKGLTAVILKDSVTQKQLPVMERREGKDWIGLRIRDKGKVTDIYINQLADGRLMHSNSWIEADGWVTDAYMFAVSYSGDRETSAGFLVDTCVIRAEGILMWRTKRLIFFVASRLSKGAGLLVYEGKLKREKYEKRSIDDVGGFSCGVGKRQCPVGVPRAIRREVQREDVRAGGCRVF